MFNNHSKPTRNRREFLTDAFCGFGSLAFGAMLHGSECQSTGPEAAALSRSAKAKSVIFLFMAGGPSQMETFDPKPLLNKLQWSADACIVQPGQTAVHQRRAEAARHEAKLSTAR